MIDSDAFNWILKIRYYTVFPLTKKRISKRKKCEFKLNSKLECRMKLKEFSTPYREIFSYTILDCFSGLMRYVET